MATTAASFDGWPLVGTTPGGGSSRILGLGNWISRGVRRTRTSRGTQDGDWPSQGQNAGRDITVSGQVEYGTDAATAALERRQMVALGGKGLAGFVVEDALGPLSALVEVDSIACTPIRDGLISWAMALHAPDPLVYGPALFASTGLGAAAGGAGLVFPMAFPLDFGLAPGVTPGSLILPNAGTATYWPRLRIDGPTVNPVVTLNETGDTVRYGGTLAAGQYLDIDLGNRKVLLQGLVSVMPAVTFTGNWLGVPEGGGSLSWSADTADPAALLSAWFYESAWE